MKRAALVAAVLCVASVTPAHADLPIGLIEDMVGGVISRTRRSIAIGPEVGFAGGVDVDGNTQQGVSFGLALYTFKIPTVFDLKAALEARIKARVADYLKQLVASGLTPPTGADLKALVEKLGKEVIDEFLGKEIRRRIVEKPGTKIVIEGRVLLEPEGFQLRAGVSRGIGKVSLGLGGGFQRVSDTTAGLVGAELSLHLTPIGKAWTPVVDGFFRTDVTLDGDTTHTVFLLGGRLTLDLL